MSIAFELLRDYNETRVCADKGTLCHAAESSMYFGRDGAVSACCYSRNGAIGRYPEQTVAEIWNGARAQAMRSALRDNVLPGGCELCADQLYARNFAGILARQFDRNGDSVPSSAPKFPAQLEFELSNKCNLECAMCSGFFSSSIRANRENLPALPQLYDSAFVEQLLPFLPHLKRAKFLGGEPFLIDVYYEIWEKLIELNPACEISITTNATVFTEKVRRVLDKLNCQIIVSLDSVVKPTYEKIRVNATMEKTLANFEIFTEYNRRKKMGLSIAVCPMVPNAEEIPGIVEFASERGAYVFFNTVVFPRSHSLKSQPIERQRELVDLYRAAPRDHGSDVARANWTALESFTRQVEFWMGEQADRTAAMRSPFFDRCAALLELESTPPAERTLLRDLLIEAEGRNEDFLVQLTDPVESLVAYFHAVWTIGGLLHGEGLLPDTEFDSDQEDLFLSHVRRTVQRPQAEKIYAEVRRFPKIVLGLAGTKSAAEFANILDEHLAAPVVRVHNE